MRSSKRTSDGDGSESSKLTMASGFGRARDGIKQMMRVNQNSRSRCWMMERGVAGARPRENRNWRRMMKIEKESRNSMINGARQLPMMMKLMG